MQTGTLLRSALLTGVLVWLCASGLWLSATAEEVRVAVATNFRLALEDLRSEFEKQTGHRLSISAGSTGKLYAQIRLGSPFDIFMAADQQHPEILVRDGFAVPGSKITYARGQLTLWAREWDSPLGPESLTNPNLVKLAIANPELAPYGKAAVDFLRAQGLMEGLGDQLVFGENVGQAFAFVQTRNAQLGLVALSQVLQKEGQRWDPPIDLYAPILQDAVLLENARKKPAALAFMAFLASEETQSRVVRMGYLP